MAKDFEQIGYKNLELLRFYVSKDIKRIDSKMQSNESELLGYFLASLVDLLIVVFFDDLLSQVISRTCNPIFQIFIKICLIISFGFLFVTIVFVTKNIRENKIKKRKIIGKNVYIVSEDKQEVIDDFDNIACDGLLICQNYIIRYKEEKEDYIKSFYLYEIIHHIGKATDICNKIYTNQSLYISSKNHQLLDAYRVNNFIIFSKKIIDFLSTEIPEDSGDSDLDTEMRNLKELVNKWEKIVIEPEL